ncbi:unnamed protein product [Trypanosoma congolense IL3000]|uniref:WGS project CAEQ00000000 data, annotated contig 1674 n=1 Tax=Trypanosoma congolense (strain IL3000) TaxID=1068625 RepID=F9W7Y1_TRYCI|nr:unnamed protein product [Trypanosoma congolense IL3000]
MTSKCDGSYVLKETILAEAPKHTRRKRTTKSCHSQVFDIICDDHADEIVEEDITRDSEKHAEAAQQENVRMHTEEILSRKKRRKQRCNRSVSFLFDSIGDEGGSAVLRESATLCGKKKIRSTRRQPRKTNERSVTFTHIEEMERACEVSEALDNTGFDPPSETVSPAKHTRMKSLRRSSSPRGGNPNFTIVEVPEDHVETIIEGDFGIMNLTSRIHSELNGSYQRNGEQNMPLPHIHKDTKDKLCGPITTPQDTVRSSNKLRKRRKEDLHKSRQLECSFVQDEIMVEIQELDNESMQLKHCSSHIPKESNVNMGGDVMADSMTLNTIGSSILPDIPSMNSPKHGLRHKRTTAHVVNVTKLPEVLASEVPDVVADSMCSTSA